LEVTLFIAGGGGGGGIAEPRWLTVLRCLFHGVHDEEPFFPLLFSWVVSGSNNGAAAGDGGIVVEL